MLDPGTKLNLCGPHVAAIRKLASPRLTQSALAEKVSKAGVKLDRSAIAKIENNLRAVTDLELVALSQSLEVSVPQLLGLKS